MICPGRDGDARIAAFADLDLEPAQAADVREHVDACARCREEVATLRSLSERIRGAYPESGAGAPGDAKERIRRALEDEMAGDVSPAPGGRRTAILVAVGMIVSVFVVFRLMMSPTGGPSFLDEAAEALADDHVACNGMPSTWITERADVEALFALEPEPRPAIPDLEAAGYSFAGALVCEVRGRRLVHLIFRSSGLASASVFVSRPGASAFLSGAAVSVEKGMGAGLVVTGVGESLVLVAAPPQTDRLAGLLASGLGG